MGHLRKMKQSKKKSLKDISLFYKANTNQGICIPLKDDPMNLYVETINRHQDFLDDIPNVGGIQWFFEQTEYHIKRLWTIVAPQYSGNQPPFGQMITFDLNNSEQRESLIIVVMNIINLTKCGAIIQDEYNGTLFMKGQL